MTFQSAQIIFLGKSKVQKILKIFSYPDEEMFASSKTRIQWRVFGMISAEDFFINAITKIIKQYLKDGINELNFLSGEIILEKILQKLNDKIILTQSLKEKKTSADILLVVIKNTELSLAGHGNIYSILLRKNRNELKNFNAIDLLKNVLTQDANFEYGFQNIVTGEILLGDILIISIGNLWKFINDENLLDCFLQLPPKNAIEFIKNKIGNRDLSGGLLILSWRTKEMCFQNVKTYGKANASLSHLINLSKETEKILTPSFKNVSIKNTFKSILKSIQNKKTEEQNSKRTILLRNGWQKKYRFVFKAIAKICLMALLTIKAVVIFLYLLGKKIFIIATDYQHKRKKILYEIGFKIENIVLKIISRFNLLPQKSKAFLILTIALTILFSQSVFIVNARLSQKIQEEKVAQTIKLIRNNLSGIEASLIYKDTKTAYNLLQESLTLFETLPQKTKQDKIRREEMAKVIDKVRFSYQRISVIQDPTVVAIFDEAKGKQILESDGKLIVAADNNGIFFVQPRERKINFVTTIADSNDTFQMLGIYGPSEILFLKNNKLFILNTQNKIIKSVFWTPPEIDLQKSLIYLHLNNLYVLNNVENKFFKIPGGSMGFGKVIDYLKDNEDVKNTLAITGDAAIYLLDKNDGIVKYVQGRKKKVDWTPLDPPFAVFYTTSASDTARIKIWTSEDSLFLYILDPIGKRLIVYNKNGDLKKQYTSPQFDELTDFVVNEKNKEIFILNGNKIYGLVAEHLAN